MLLHVHRVDDHFHYWCPGAPTFDRFCYTSIDSPLASSQASAEFILVIVLQSALDVRIGDILAPDNDEGSTARPGLRYSEMHLVLDGNSMSDIKGQWLIRNANTNEWI